MSFQHSPETETQAAEHDCTVVTEGPLTNRDRAEVLAEARASDAANYVWRYEQFSKEVMRLKFADAIASLAFPATAYVMGLFVLVRALLWVVEHSGGDRSSFAGTAFFMLIFGVVGLTLAASWVADRERRARKRDQNARIQEIADRHGVDPSRPRMEE